MSNRYFVFGESLPGYPVPVLNERAVRASAGVLFLFAIVSFMNAWLQGNFRPTRVFVVAFLIDFTIRIFVNPRFAPSLILGSWFVRKQQPEYVGAPQKRFAWAIGYALALAMFYLVVLKSVIGPVNLIICLLCLLLLFFESAFGICIGCWIYGLLKGRAELCPGNVCDYTPGEHARTTLGQALIVVTFLVVVGSIAHQLRATPEANVATVADRAPSSETDGGSDPCKVPDFAKAMGHEKQWKLHNGCR